MSMGIPCLEKCQHCGEKYTFLHEANRCCNTIEKQILRKKEEIKRLRNEIIELEKGRQTRVT